MARVTDYLFIVPPRLFWYPVKYMAVTLRHVPTLITTTFKLPLPIDRRPGKRQVSL